MISFAPAALSHFEQAFLAETKRNDDVAGIRIGVKKSGCSGYEYAIEFITEILPDDKVLMFSDLVIVMDKPSSDALKETEVSYNLVGLNEEIQFKNPNVAELCGCGQSFSLKSS